MACDCITEMNDLLRPHNTQLALTIVFGKGMPALPSIGVEQVEKGRGKPKAKAILPMYCPFCGYRYSVDDAA